MAGAEEDDFVEDLKTDFYALKYFTMGKLKGYEKEMTQMKKQMEEKDKKAEEEVTRLKDRIRELEERESLKRNDSEESTSSSSSSISEIDVDGASPPSTYKKKAPTPKERVSLSLTPKFKRHNQSTSTVPFKVPKTINDLTSEWSDKLKDVIVSPQKSDLLTEAQLTFFTHWTNSRKNLMANNAQVMELIKSGVEAGVWNKGWSPSTTSNLTVYLLNRIKNLLTKRKRLAAIKKTNQEFDMFEYLDA